MLPARIQSALDAAGVQAARIEWLWWLMFWVCTGVFVLVLAALAAALWRGRSADPQRPRESALFVGVAAATGATIVILFGLLYASVSTGRAMGTMPSNPLVVRIVGHQWWWEIEYVDEAPSERVTLANELRLPVGRAVRFDLSSADVIHSFWIPNLHGKVDLIPGRQTETWLRADVPGTLRGQCAEFCGVQHAHMSLPVFVETQEQFDRWLTAQKQNAAAPATTQTQRGLHLVEAGPCALCHTIRGTQAGGRIGPDLTHVATRATLAAGTAPNVREYLSRWLADPQHLKPGNQMPPTGLHGDDLQAVVAYLETLK